MGEHRNVEDIRETYDAFAAGDLTKALRNLAPAGVFHFGGTGALSGDRMGLTHIKEALVGAYALSGGTRRFEINHVYADDRHGVVLLREQASRPDGLSIDLHEAHVIEYDDQGRISDLWDIPDDPEAHDRFFDKEMGPRPEGAPVVEHPNVETIRQTYNALVAGDLPSALKALAPEGTLHFGGTGPLHGDHRGVDRVGAVLSRAATLTAGTQKLDVTAIYADDNHGVVVVRERASRPDGATLDVDEVHMLSFSGDGLITDIWDLPSDREAHDRFFDGQ